MSSMREVDGGVLLNLEVKPRSSFNKITVYGDEIIVYLKNSSVKGRANRELLKSLCKALKATIDEMKIVRGITSSAKSILIQGINLEEIRGKLVKMGEG